MNMNSYGSSGFQSSSDMSSNFEFSAPKLGVENPTLSLIPRLSKPRFVKAKNNLNSKSKGSSDTRTIDPGYNPFRPISNNVGGVPSRLDGDAPGGGLGSENRGGGYVDKNVHLNLKVASKVEKVGNELVDEIRKLRIENQSGSKGLDSSLPPELPQELKRMNLGGSCSVESGVSGAARGSHGGSGVNVGGSVGIPLGAELPSDLSRLNLRDSGEVGGRSFGFSNPGINDSVFGSTRAKNDPVVDSTLSDTVRNLKLRDPDGSNGTQEETNVNMSNPAFVTRSTETVSGSGGVIDTMVLDDMEKLNIGGTSQGPSDNANLNDKHSTAPHAPQLNKSSGLSGTPVSSTSTFPSGNFHFQPARGEYQVPRSDETEKREGFNFTGKQECTSMPSVEFRTPAPSGNLFTQSNKNMEFVSRKGTAKVGMSRGRKGKVKGPNPVLVSIAKNFTPMETSMQPEPSESYSPMDVSPYRETQDDAQSSREPSLTCDDTASSTDTAKEELVAATERMEINEGNDLKHGEQYVRAPVCSVNTDVDRDRLVADCVSATEDVSFNTAADDLDNEGESEVESKYEVEDCDQTQFFSASSSMSSGGSSFTFGASSSSHGQVSGAMRQNKKKNQMKSGPDIYIPTRIDLLSDATSSLLFSPISKASVLPSQVGRNDVVSNAPLKGSFNRKTASPTSRTAYTLEDTNKGIRSPTAAARAAQESCERWRSRGNKAYAIGDFEKAEDCYTQELSCIPRHETSRDCQRSLVHCYSNRAAARMSIGRMSEALQDCLVAAEIDPNFFRVQLRAANCYLALGEIGNASRYFKKLLQSTDVCVERKIILEASDGLQKAQKVSECMDNSSAFLQQRTFPDAESALEIISEALVISPYSEQLLASKAEALFMLRRYEEVIQLCVHSLAIAEKNFSKSRSSELLSNMDAELLENYSFCIWRFGFIFKSNFCLGKLEEGIEFLEKQEKWSSVVAKYGNEALESQIPYLSTARELIRHKSAGNGAFQSERHTEAVEHYTAALSFNVESRPFAAVCFGNRAAALQALGQITDAVADCSLAIALDGNYLKAISRRATLFEMIRDYDQAAKDLERLVSLITKQAEEKAGASVPTGSLADLRQARQRLHQMEEQARRGTPLNFYLILGVEPSVTATDLKKAYRKAALRHHPDKAGQSLARSESGDDGLWKKIAEEVYKDTDKLFKMVGEAYAVLSDPTKRSQYDIEEEIRNVVKKNSNSTSRMPSDAPIYTEERGGARRQWREGWRSSANPYSRGFEPSRPGRYY